VTAVVFFAVLGAAAFHAAWNALVKSGGDKFQTMLLMSTSQGLMGLAVAIALPFPARESWPWLLGSAGIHSSYKIALTYAYQHGDLSRVYPIARGTAPLIVAAFGILLLPDVVTPREYAGIFLLALGVLFMASGVFSNRESRFLLTFSLASAAATAGYTLVDGLGARISTNVTAYVAWMFFLDGFLFLSWVLVFRGRWAVPVPASGWARGIAAGAASFLAYWIAVWAMSVAPIVLVSALRETSILFAVLIGVMFFGERGGAVKLASAGLIILGVIVMRV